MLLDPFEEQFHVPTFAVEFCYGQGFITEMVGQEAVDVACGEVFVSDHPQFFGITFDGLVDGDHFYAEFICLSQCVARNSVTDTAHIQLVGDGRLARFDVPETVLVRVLRHAHDQELVVASEVPDTIVPVVSGYAIVELTSWNEGHELGKHCASLVHRGWGSGLCRKTIDSNRVHQETLISN